MAVAAAPSDQTHVPYQVARHFGLTRKEWQSLGIGLLFISPWLIGFVAFLLYPLLYTLRISFTRYSGFGEATWIGWGNYERMFQDDLFWKSLYNTLYYTGLAVPIGAVMAMVLALAMNQPLREVGIYRALLYLPSVLPVFAITFIFIALLDPNKGLVTRVWGSVGLPNVNWLGDPRYMKIALVALAQLGAGQAALVFLAGLKGIPITLYEAAMLDGAGTWRKFWNVTLPLMTPVILYNLILGLSLGLQTFTQAYILAPDGGPGNAVSFYVLYLYDNAFRYSQMGYASAMAWGLFVITLVLALVVFKWSQRWVHYDTA